MGACLGIVQMDEDLVGFHQVAILNEDVADGSAFLMLYRLHIGIDGDRSGCDDGARKLGDSGETPIAAELDDRSLLLRRFIALGQNPYPVVRDTAVDTNLARHSATFSPAY